MTDMPVFLFTGIAAIAVCMVAARVVVMGIYRAIDRVLDAVMNLRMTICGSYLEREN